MGKRYEKLSLQNREFIADQKMFFIASCSGKEVNLSPRGYDCFRVTGDNEAVFLDYVGSGNRTARDIESDGEITVVFCSFNEKPLILRLFCKGELVDKSDESCRALFDTSIFEGMRRFVKLHIYCVETSCGEGVPLYEFKGERNELREWCVKGEQEGKLAKYAADHATPPDLTEFKERF